MAENISDYLPFDYRDGKIRLSAGDVSTNWLSEDDTFLKRLENLNLNPVFSDEHLSLEIEMKNILDSGFSQTKPARAIELFDEVIYYDENYAEALIGKSYALREQKHFVKSLRYYKKAIRADESLKDNDYYRMLLGEANRERDSFSKLKLNIYAGDEYFSKGEYEKALNSYKKALKDKSKFKDKILFKLLNKTATAYLKLDDFNSALDCFRQSVRVFENDYACFGCGICEYELGEDVSDEFKKPLKISKYLSLRQALVLNELGFFGESLVIVDDILRMHFVPDDLYFRLLSAKRYALTELGRDVSEVDEIFEKLSLN